MNEGEPEARRRSCDEPDLRSYVWCVRDELSVCRIGRTCAVSKRARRLFLLFSAYIEKTEGPRLSKCNVLVNIWMELGRCCHTTASSELMAGCMHSLRAVSAYSASQHGIASCVSAAGCGCLIRFVFGLDNAGHEFAVYARL